MSGKIKAKDLSYDSSLPPFLQRLHAKNAGRGDTDRHERAIARPTRAKDPNDDDGPTIVDDSGETLTKDEVDKLTTDAADEVKAADGQGDSAGDGEAKASGALPTAEVAGGKRMEQSVTSGTAQKKRKVAKVVGEEVDEDGGDATKTDAAGGKAAKKMRKKAKQLKLAFDEDEAS